MATKIELRSDYNASRLRKIVLRCQDRNWGNLPGFGKAPIPCQQGRPFCNE